MKARPILMHGRSVRNLLAGRKTQTRRICKDQSALSYRWVKECPTHPPGSHFTGWTKDCGHPFLLPTKCPYGQPGDLLYVRETHAYQANEDGALTGRILYRATHEGPLEKLDENGAVIDGASPWRPSIHMPRWASRITLRLTDVRVERVQEITYDDAIAEGAPAKRVFIEDQPTTDERAGFAELWGDTNGAGAWDCNDWVWVLTFEVIHANVDEVLADAA